MSLIIIVQISPILYLYLSANSTSTSNAFIFLLPQLPISLLVLTYLQPFGIYILLVFPFYKKNTYYWVTLFTLIGLSWIKYSGDHNFSRSFNPALFILMILIIKYMLHDSFFQKTTIPKYILCFCLTIGYTFFMQRFFNPIIDVITKGPIPMKFSDYADTQGHSQWSNKDYKNTAFSNI